MSESNADQKRSNTLSRRELLAQGGVLGAATALSGVAAQAEARKAKPDMPTAILGRTGVRVSRLAHGGSWDVDAEVISLGLELGINYLDTAETYRGGQSERAFGEFLNARGATGHSAERKKLWIVSKSHDHHNLERHLQPTLDRLQQDYLDCYYMHQLLDPKLAAAPEIKAMAERLKKSGKVRFFGFSAHDDDVVPCLNTAAEGGFVDVIMFRYDSHFYPRPELDRAIDRCVKANIGLVAMKTQVGGMTFPDRFNVFKQRGLNQYQAAIKAVAADSRIASICSEMVTTDQVQLNAEAVASKLTVGESDAIKEHARMMSHLWCRGCEHLCRAESGAGAQIAVADTLRFLMYHDHYGKRDHARELFASLPAEQRDLKAIEEGDWSSAEAACPFHVPLAKLMARAKERLV